MDTQSAPLDELQLTPADSATSAPVDELQLADQPTLSKSQADTELTRDPLGAGSTGYKPKPSPSPTPKFSDVWFPNGVSTEARAGAARVASPQAAASKAAGMPLADVAGKPHDPQEDVPVEYNPKTGMPFKPSLVPALDAPGFIPGANLERNVESAATEFSRLRDNDKPAYGVDPNNRFGPPVRILPKEEEERQRRQRLDAAAGIVDNAMNVAGPVTAPMIVASGPVAALKAGVGIGAGYLASEHGGNLVHGKVSPEAEHAIRTSLFFLPSLAGTVAGLETPIGKTPEGYAAGVKAFGGKVGAGVRSTPEAFEGAVKVGDTRVGARIPRAPVPQPSEAAKSLASFEQHTGNPDFQPAPPTPVPPGANGPEHLTPDVVKGVSDAIMQAPAAKRPGLMTEAHGSMVKWMVGRGTFVGPDHKIHTVDSEGQAKKLASKFINDEVDRRDAETEQAAKAKPEAQPLTDKAKLPDYLRETIQQDHDTAKRLGIADDIEELSAQGLTAKQVTARLADKFQQTPIGDRAQIVRSVRAARGIPSQDNMSEIEEWRQNRAATQPTTTAPIAGKPPAAGNMTTETAAVQKVATEANIHPKQKPAIAVKKEPPKEAAALAKPPEHVKLKEVAAIGKKEPESGRTILQPSDDVMQNERLAAHAAPELATKLSHIAAGVEGATFDRLRPQKELERVDEKVDEAGKPPETVPDYLAAQIAADTPRAKDQLVAALKKHFNVVNVEDNFLEGKPELANYRSVNLQVGMGNGATAEVQIVPRELQEIANESHVFYTAGREAGLRGDTAEQEKQFAKAAEMHDAAMEKFNKRNGIGPQPKHESASTQQSHSVPLDELEPVERRTNTAERKRVEHMTPEERSHQLLTSELTGLPNKRAFAEDTETLTETHPHVGYADIDDFKQFNSILGHEGVDEKVLPEIGEVFRRAAAKEPGGSVKVYHRSGDEFLFRSKDETAIGRVVDRVNKELETAVFTAESPDGKIHTKQGAGLSYGTGRDAKSAEHEADYGTHAGSKKSRTAAGQRSGSRDLPERVGEEPAGGKQVDRVQERVEDSKRANGREDEGVSERLRSAPLEELEAVPSPGSPEYETLRQKLAALEIKPVSAADRLRERLASKAKDEAKRVADRLRTVADGLDKQIEDKQRPMTQNATPKRMREYRSRLHDGDNLKRVQQAMRALADAHESGAVPKGLEDVRTKDEIHRLVYKGTENGGYYDVIPSQDYANKTPQGKALQELMERHKNEPSEAKAGREKASKISQLEADVQFQKLPGYFPTPKPIVERMLDAADIQPGDKVLEPSAGKGNIADLIKEREPEAKLSTIEQQSKLRQILELKGHELAGSDFLEHEGQYDRIVMNPPFENGQDIDHVQRAFGMLKPGGKLVAIMSESPFFRSDRKGQAFREWLEEHGGTSEKLEPGAFKESGTGVNARMVEIEKPADRQASHSEPSQAEKSIRDKYGVAYSLPRASSKANFENGRDRFFLFKDGAASEVTDGHLKAAEAVIGKQGSQAHDEFLKRTGAIRFLADVYGDGNVSTLTRPSAAQMTKLAASTKLFNWDLHDGKRYVYGSKGTFRDFSKAVDDFYGREPETNTVREPISTAPVKEKGAQDEVPSQWLTDFRAGIADTEQKINASRESLNDKVHKLAQSFGDLVGNKEEDQEKPPTLTEAHAQIDAMSPEEVQQAFDELMPDVETEEDFRKGLKELIKHVAKHGTEGLEPEAVILADKEVHGLLDQMFKAKDEKAATEIARKIVHRGTDIAFSMQESEHANEAGRPAGSPEARPAAIKQEVKGKPTERGFARLDIPSVAKEAITNYLEKRREASHFTTQARLLEEGLAGLDRKYEADVMDTRNMLRSVTKAFTPTEQEAVYHAIEARRSAGLSDREKALKDDFVKPVQTMNQALREELTGFGWGDLYPQDGYIHRIVEGKPGRLESAAQGQQGGKGNLLSRSTPSTKERRMFVLEDADGHRMVVHKADGRITGFDRGKPVDMGAYRGLKPDGEFTSKDGRMWTLKQATTKEIEGATDIRYYKSAMAVTALDNLELQRAVNAARFLESFKSRPEFDSVAMKVDAGDKVPQGWKHSQIPQFRGYAFEPRTREVLDDLHDRMTNYQPPNTLEKIGDFLQTSILLNPLMHVANMGDIWATERGALRTAQIWKADNSVRAGMRALHAVTARNDDYLDALRAGAPLMSHKLLVRDLNRAFQDVLTGAVKDDAGLAAKMREAMALPAGVNPIEAIRGASHSGAFMSNDIFLLQSVYDKMESSGANFESALRQTMKVFPEYRVPTRVADSKILADLMKNRLMTWFSGYHYGKWRAFRNMAADSVRPGASAEDRTWALSRIAMLGLLVAVVYPAYQTLIRKLSGDPNARVKRFGLSGTVQNMIDVHEGKKDVTQAVESEVTPSALLKGVIETATNRDSFTGNYVRDPNASGVTQTVQSVKHLAGSAIGPVSQYRRYSHEPGGLKKFLWSQIGVSFPKTETETKAAILMNRIRREHYAPMTPEEQQEFEDKIQRIADGKLTPQEMHSRIKSLMKNEFENGMKSFTYGQAKQVYDVATPEEKAMIGMMLLRKKFNSRGAAGVQ